MIKIDSHEKVHCLHSVIVHVQIGNCPFHSVSTVTMLADTISVTNVLVLCAVVGWSWAQVEEPQVRLPAFYNISSSSFQTA